MKEIHRADLQGTIYDGREVVHAIEFKPDGLFGAIAESEVYLKDLGYTIGRISRQKPIGFAYECDHIGRWGNLNESIKSSLEGVIIPQGDYREGGVLVIFYSTPRY